MPAFVRLAVAAVRRHAPAGLVAGLAAYGSGELAVRFVRLCTILVIGRILTPDLVGQAAIALTLFELIRVIARNGVGAAIIASPEEGLAMVCNRAHRLFWRWAWVLVAVQLGVAGILGTLFAQPQAAAMLAVLSLVYPLMPGGLVQVHLAMREGLAGRTAANAAIQTGADHLLTAALLIAFPSPWSLVLPKLLTAPIWLVLSRRARPWRPDPAAGEQPIPGLVRLGAGMMGAEALGALRANGDNLLVAALLGTQALGTYYFAFAAGLGITGALIGAIAGTVYPLLCRAAPAERAETMRRTALLAGGGGALLVAAQAAAALVYVPLLFGANWTAAAPIVAVLCLAGIPQLAQALLGHWLRATGRAPLEAAAALLACAGALGGLAAGAASGSLMLAAAGLTAGQFVAALVAILLFLPRRAGAPATPSFQGAA